MHTRSRIVIGSTRCQLFEMSTNTCLGARELNEVVRLVWILDSQLMLKYEKVIVLNEHERFIDFPVAMSAPISSSLHNLYLDLDPKLLESVTNAL